MAFLCSRSGQNTNFWDPEVFPADPKGAGEITQGKNLVDAAKEVGVKFFIWRSVSGVHQFPILILCQLSTQRDKGVQRALQAYLPCRQSVGSLPHFCRRSSIRSADKGVIEDYLRASGVPFAALFTGWFAENLYKCIFHPYYRHCTLTFPLYCGRLGALQKTDTGYSIPIAKFGPEDTQTMTWVAHDLGQAAVAN
jgi:hypothetical protein